MYNEILDFTITYLKESKTLDFYLALSMTCMPWQKMLTMQINITLRQTTCWSYGFVPWAVTFPLLLFLFNWGVYIASFNFILLNVHIHQDEQSTQISHTGEEKKKKKNTIMRWKYALPQRKQSPLPPHRKTQSDSLRNCSCSPNCGAACVAVHA